MTKVRLCCPDCGSTDIVRDATATWNEDTQDWECSGVQDAMTCHECWNEFNEAKEVVIDGTYRIAFYELGQSYGGPEEGGWWYDTGRLVREARVEFVDREAASRYCRRANDLLRAVQRKLRPVHSAAYSGGRYGAQVCQGEPERGYPATRPRYE